MFTDLEIMKERLANAMNFEDEAKNFSMTFQPDEVTKVNKGTQPTKMSMFSSKTLTPVQESVMKPMMAQAMQNRLATESSDQSVQKMLILEESLKQTIEQLKAELIAEQQASNQSTNESTTIITRSGTVEPESSKETLTIPKTSRILE